MQKLIPPYLLFISILLMMLLHFLSPVLTIITQPWNYAGGLFIIGGLAAAKMVSKTFEQVKTEIHTFKKPKQMVTTGLFQYSRNPIYLGFTLLLFGLTVLLGSLTPLLILILFVIITDKWYIPVEERNMEEQFGADYRKYKEQTRRWI
jgi:protein-S-isoprenylcysteine O-methyltransferase Ste14